MPPNISDFIKLTDAPDYYRVSTKTLRRRIDQARKSKENGVLDYFVVQTRDGEMFQSPENDTVKNLVKQGRMPDWYVDHKWLQSEFGAKKIRVDSDKPVTTAGVHPWPSSSDQPKTDDVQPVQPVDHPNVQPSSNLSPEIRELIDSYKAHIDDLKQQLTVQEKMLTRLLPERTATSERATEQKPLPSATPKVEPVRTQPAAKQPAKPKAKQPATPAPKRSKAGEFFRKLLDL